MGAARRQVGEAAVNKLVAIRRASGKRSLIAEQDFDPALHTLWDAPQAPPAASPRVDMGEPAIPPVHHPAAKRGPGRPKGRR